MSGAEAAEPRVSILSVCYNHAPYLDACARSVLAQGMQRWEWLVHDDGSSDRSAELLEALGDPRVRILRGAHRGPGALADAFNGLLARAKGRWVALLDTDDAWPADKLEAGLAAGEASDAILVHGEYAPLGGLGPESARIRPHRDPRVLANQPLGAATAAALEELNFPAITTSALVLREALLRARGFVQVGPTLMDYGTFLRLSLQGPFLFLPRPMTYWRRHPGQLSQSRTMEQLAANRDYARAFLREHEKEILAAGRDPRGILGRMEFNFLRHGRTWRLWRAQGLLDAGAYGDARRGFGDYLREDAGRGGLRFARYWAIGVLGWVSSAARVNASRWALDLRDRAAPPA